jgi:hypothetical protein
VLVLLEVVWGWCACVSGGDFGGWLVLVEVIPASHSRYVNRLKIYFIYNYHFRCILSYFFSSQIIYNPHSGIFYLTFLLPKTTFQPFCPFLGLHNFVFDRYICFSTTFYPISAPNSTYILLQITHFYLNTLKTCQIPLICPTTNSCKSSLLDFAHKKSALPPL